MKVASAVFPFAAIDNLVWSEVATKDGVEVVVYCPDDLSISAVRLIPWSQPQDTRAVAVELGNEILLSGKLLP